jgi:hypothetical protein
MLRKLKFLSLAAATAGLATGPERWHVRVRDNQDRKQGSEDVEHQARGSGIS